MYKHLFVSFVAAYSAAAHSSTTQAETTTAKYEYKYSGTIQNEFGACSSQISDCSYLSFETLKTSGAISIEIDITLKKDSYLQLSTIAPITKFHSDSIRFSLPLVEITESVFLNGNKTSVQNLNTLTSPLSTGSTLRYELMLNFTPGYGLSASIGSGCNNFSCMNQVQDTMFARSSVLISTTPIPEPSSILMAAAGLIVLGSPIAKRIKKN